MTEINKQLLEALINFLSLELVAPPFDEIERGYDCGIKYAINTIKRAIANAEAAQPVDTGEDLGHLIAEYLHWRKVNPHIKGGDNYLKRFRDALQSAGYKLVRG